MFFFVVFFGGGGVSHFRSNTDDHTLKAKFLWRIKTGSGCQM